MSTSHKAAPIRRAEAAQLPAVRTVLAGAFETSALMRWALPDDATRRDAVAAWLGPLLDRYLVVGRVDVAEDDEGVVAVAAWRPPAPLPDDPVLHSSPSSAGVLAAILGVERSQRVLEILSGTGQYAPDEPVHYLHLLAVRPGAQGRGHGSRLVRHALAEHDASGTTTWLATADEQNLPFYGRLGYVVVGEVDLEGAASLRVLHRRPGGR